MLSPLTFFPGLVSTLWAGTKATCSTKVAAMLTRRVAMPLWNPLLLGGTPCVMN